MWPEIIAATIVAIGAIIAAKVHRGHQVRDLMDEVRFYKQENQKLIADRQTANLLQESLSSSNFSTGSGSLQRLLPEHGPHLVTPRIMFDAGGIVCTSLLIVYFYNLQWWMLVALIGLAIGGTIYLFLPLNTHSGYVRLPRLCFFVDLLMDKQLRVTSEDQLSKMQGVLSHSRKTQSMSILFAANQVFSAIGDDGEKTEGEWKWLTDRNILRLDVNGATFQISPIVLNIAGTAGCFRCQSAHHSIDINFEISST